MAGDQIVSNDKLIVRQESVNQNLADNLSERGKNEEEGRKKLSLKTTKYNVYASFHVIVGIAADAGSRHLVSQSDQMISRKEGS